MGVRVLFIAAGCQPEVRTFEAAPFLEMRPSLNALIGCTDQSLSRLLWGDRDSGVWWHTNLPPNSTADGYVCGFQGAPMQYLDYDRDLPHAQVLEALELFREFTRIDKEFWSAAMQAAFPAGRDILFVPQAVFDAFVPRLDSVNRRAARLHPHLQSPPPFRDSLDRQRVRDPAQILLAGLPP